MAWESVSCFILAASGWEDAGLITSQPVLITSQAPFFFRAEEVVFGQRQLIRADIGRGLSGAYANR